MGLRLAPLNVRVAVQGKCQPVLFYEMVDIVEPDQAYDDEVDGNDVVQQPRHYQNQNAGDKSDERRDVGGGESHFKSPRAVGISINSDFLTSPRAGPGSPGVTVCRRAHQPLW